MPISLTIASALPLMASLAVNVHGSSLHLPTSVQHSAGTHFALPVIPQFNPQSPLQDGLIAREEVAPNAQFGLGLAPMLGRNIHSVRIEQELVPTRNPGVTFVLKFPG